MNNTKEDGSDLGSILATLFFTLNQPPQKRMKTIDESLNEFPYVNGKLFEEQLPPTSFDRKMRDSLLKCCSLDWSKISPAIFGSMFQSVMNPVERRNLGAHYTSETNILKLIKPLFLDELWAEFDSIKTNRNKLIDFHKKLAHLQFLDPACGCGNFLIITYRELRLLEMEILKVLNKKGEQFTNISTVALLDVDQMYGIEIEEFPVRIAEVAMWLTDHQMNMLVSDEFGQNFARLPLQKSATIIHGNALRLDWGTLVKPRFIETYFFDMGRKQPAGKVELIKTEFSYILGNPPFVGKHLQHDEQKKDMDIIFGNIKGTGVLDYVTAWYIKAARYIQNRQTKVAFVSTNSISQGEQVGILWGELFNKYHIKIHFVHRTFKWRNEAKGVAAVHVVIIGFASFDCDKKFLFEYGEISGEPHEVKVNNINQYLIDAKEIIISPRTNPIINVPKIGVGSALLDGGFLILSELEKKTILEKEPILSKYIKRFWSADEFINNNIKWCFWLKDVTPDILKGSRVLQTRINQVKSFRLNSSRGKTFEMADFPYLFGEERQPNDNFLLIPKVSSENRKYIPIGYMTSQDIITDKVFAFPKASLYHFGILTSKMHMSWMKYICGRLESRYSYSNTIVYNNFPWPENPTEKQKEVVEVAAQHVLDVRKEFPDSSLADLYDPNTMPPKLVKAHNDLDKAVDKCYRSAAFPTEAKRMEFLFELYEKYTNPLTAGIEKKGKK